MKRTVVFLAVMTALLVLSGCSTKTYYQPIPGEATVQPTASFVVGKTEDLSGYKFSDEDKDKFDLATAMDDALKAELGKAGALRLDGADYVIDTKIINYAPGNAALRWLLPGAGETRLTVESSIINNEGRVVAKIPVDRQVAAGGVQTVGAYKYVFEDVAKAIVTVLRDETKRQAPK